MWMDLENIMLSERSQTQKDTRWVTPLMGNVQNRQIHRECIPGCQGLGDRGVTANGDGAYFWGDENVLKLMMEMDAQLCEYTKNQ